MPHTPTSAPLSPPIELAKPEITDEDRAAVADALADGKIAFGPVVDAFERAVATACGGGEGVAVNSGTAALHLALLAVGVKPDDEVLLPSLTFVAPANTVRYTGAHPVLFDSEPQYRQLDIERLGAWLERQCESREGEAFNRVSGRRVKALIAVDLLGHPCDVETLREVAPPGIAIIEDAAQSFGGQLRGRPLGQAADALCLSFNANKVITSGGGGMVVSRSQTAIRKIRLLANQAKAPGEEYVHREIGFNYRLPTGQAALGLSQLERLDKILLEKQRIAEYYRESLGELPGLRMPEAAPWASATEWLFTIEVDESDFGINSRELMRALARRQIETRPLFTPLHADGVHEGLEAHSCAVAKELARNSLSLPSAVTLQEEELARVSKAITALRGSPPSA